MKITFWAYGAADECAGRYAGFCGHGPGCACHDDCVVIDVVEMTTWNEARRHGNFLGDFGPEDSVTDPDLRLIDGSEVV